MNQPEMPFSPETPPAGEWNTAPRPDTPDECDTPVGVRDRFSHIGFSVLLLSAVYLLSSMLFQTLLLRFFPEAARSQWAMWGASLFPLYGIALPLAYLLLRGVPTAPHCPDYHRNGQRIDQKPPFTFKTWALFFVIGMGLMYIGNIIGVATMNVLSLLTGYDYQNDLNALVGGSSIPLTILCGCILGPIGEEFIFRKLLIDRTRRYGDTVSILLSAFLFALFHGNLFQFFYAFLIGVILGYCYTRTGQLRWSAALHGGINFMGTIVGPALMTYAMEHLALDAEKFPTEYLSGALVQLFVIIMMYGLAIAAVILLSIRAHNAFLSRGTVTFRRKSPLRPSAVWLNPGMMLCIVFLLFVLLTNLIPPTWLA